MPQKDLTVPQAETFPGGLCLLTMDPESPFLIVEQLAQGREQTTGHACMAPAFAQCNCRVLQSTSDEAPGLLAYVAQELEAHHAPDWFQVQQELVNAVSGPMATKERAAQKAVSDATEPRARLQSNLQSAGDAPAKRHPGRVPKAPRRLEHAEPTLDTARREPARLAEQRAQVQASIRGIGPDSHCVDLERGVRRNGQLIAADSHEHLAQIRTLAQHAGRSQRCGERIDTAERVVPKMQATLEFVSGYVRQPGAQLEGTPPVSFAMHAQLLPSYDLDRVAQSRSLSDGAPLHEFAARLRAPLLAPGGILWALPPETQDHLHAEAKRLATVFQRSSANGEGRNGY